MSIETIRTRRASRWRRLRRREHLAGGGLLGLCLCLATEAQGQSLQPLDEVVVRATPQVERARARVFLSPEALSAIDESTARDVAAQSLADALRASPSVSVQQTTPGQGTIYVRGLSGRAVFHALDGVRLNTAFFRAGNNDYLGLIDPFALTEVIVVPGAASVEHGSDALGGAVLMSTGLPRYRNVPTTSYAAYQSLTSNPWSTASRLTLAHEARDWGVKAGLTHYQAGPIRPGQDQPSPEPATYHGLERTPGEPYSPVLSALQLGTEFEAYAGDAALRAALGDTTDLVLRGQVFVRPELLRYDQVTPRFGREFPRRAEAGLRPLSRAMLSAAITDRPWAGWYDSAEVLVAWQRIHEHRFQRTLRETCSPPADGGAACAGTLRLEPAPSRATEDNASHVVSLRAEARKSDPSDRLSLTWGVDARRDVISSSARTLHLSTLVHTRAPARYPDGSSLTEGGVFARSRVRLTSNLQLFAGVRGAAFHLDIPERSGELSSPAIRDTLFDGVGSIGAHWEFAEGVAWAFNAARGVRAPNVEDFAGVGQRAGGRFQVANPDLRPEHSLTADTGLKLARERQALQAFIFYSQHRDAIILAPATVDEQMFDDSGDRLYRSTNASSVELYGFEGVLDVALTPQVGLRARALVMQGVQQNDAGTRLPERTPADRAPPAQAELGVSYVFFPGLEAELLAVGRAPQRRLNDPVNLDDNRIPAGGTPGYVTYHLRGKLASDPLTVRLALDNLTDELVLEHGSGFFRAGFSATASLEVKFAVPSAQPTND